MQIAEIINIIEKIAVPGYAAPWDKSGVQVPSNRQSAEFVAVMLDPSPGNISRALEQGADFILSHHPLALKPRFPDKLDSYHRVLYLLLANQAWLYSAHTSLDSNPAGPATWAADALGLKNRRIMEITAFNPRLSFYTQVKKAEKFIERTNGNEGALPPELDLTVTQDGNGAILSCPANLWPKARKRLLEIAPAAFWVPLEARPDAPGSYAGLGFYGDLPSPLPYADFCRHFAEATGIRQWSACGPVPKTVARVACCPGSGSSLLEKAEEAGANVFITGDVKYHAAQEAQIRVLDVGHFSLEEEMVRRFALLLEESMPEIRVSFFSSSDPFTIEQL